MFEKVLIANRGEIAVRVIRTCKRLGIRTVALFSEIDSRSLHVREADEAVFLGDSRSEASYLNKEKIIDTALSHRCEAIHPGYGFLSENFEFAEMVSQSGLIFIGPPATVIATLGDKIASKNLAEKAGLPFVPGNARPLADLDEAMVIAEDLGYPVLLKPSAGGGGKGMRAVLSKDELAPALKASQEETRKAFGDDKIFIERFITHPRHIEIQIMADQFGNVIHLGERECSIQRRYQKIIEESPSPAVDDELRREMGNLACALSREAGYINAGTVEFILDRERNFYFLEMNTRLQVEHPVTEMVTSLDLVELQLSVAAGERLAFNQHEVHFKGWAIEARICAEDPALGFMPSTGMITRYAAPKGRNIRLDSGIEAGSLVSVYYDSMLAKMVAWGETREEARTSLIHALNRTHLEGVISNTNFANAILNHPAFIKGDMSTGFIEEYFDEGEMKTATSPESLYLMVMAATLVYHNRKTLVRDSLQSMVAKVGQAHEQKAWYPYRVKDEANTFSIELLEDPSSKNNWTISVNEGQYEVITPDFEFYRRRLKLMINGERHYFYLQYKEHFIWVAFCGITRTFEIYSPREWELAKYMPKGKRVVIEDVLHSPMPGLVVEIKAEEGERVYRGQDLVIIESMKMESGVSSPCDGVVEEIRIQVGQAVETGDVLIIFKL
jgi:propionyl-CoA carboxylase alpha chain